MGRTLAEKVWDAHVVRSAPQGEPDLLYIDLHLIHEVTRPQAFDGLRLAGRAGPPPRPDPRDRGPQRPDARLGPADHGPGQPHPGRDAAPQRRGVRRPAAPARRRRPGHRPRRRPAARADPAGHDDRLRRLATPRTHGAFGALAFGIGTSEVEHVLATQTLPQARPKTMAVTVNGSLPDGVTAKDLVLTLIAQIGTGGGQGYVVEYRGAAIEALSMEARMTVCNMTIESGAKAGLIAPDQTTFDYLEGRPEAPDGRRVGRRRRVLEDAASPTTTRCSTTRSSSTPSTMTPFVTWGTNPGQGVPLARRGPAPRRLRRGARTASPPSKALEYMGLEAGTPMRDIDGRHRLRRLVHQRPDRGPAARGRDPRGPQGRRGHAAARRAGLGPGPAAGRGRGSRRGLQGGRRRVARRRLLDVPGHEPRPARARRAQRLDVQPQLRGPPGQGRAHPPGLGPGRRRHRGPRHPLLARRPATVDRGADTS